MLLLAGGLLLALVAAGCGSGDPGSAGGDSEPPPVMNLAVDPAQLLEGSGTVLDDGSGPQLCLGGVAESLPPQCGGIPLVGWDWGAVEGEESAAGTTWGDFQVVGTYDGEVFTVTDAGPLRRRDGCGRRRPRVCDAVPGARRRLGRRRLRPRLR